MLTSCGFHAFIHLRYILWIPLEWLVNCLNSWTSTGYFSNSTGSSATNRRFFPDIASSREGPMNLGDSITTSMDTKRTSVISILIRSREFVGSTRIRIVIFFFLLAPAWKHPLYNCWIIIGLLNIFSYDVWFFFLHVCFQSWLQNKSDWLRKSLAEVKSKAPNIQVQSLARNMPNRLRNIAYPLSNSALNITTMGIDTHRHLRLLVKIYSLKISKRLHLKLLNCTVPIGVLHLYVDGCTKRIGLELIIQINYTRGICYQRFHMI